RKSSSSWVQSHEDSRDCGKPQDQRTGAVPREDGLMRISLRRCPPTSALFVDYLESWERVQSFYSCSYSLESIERFARERQPLESTHRRVLCDVLGEQQKQWGSNPRGVDRVSWGGVGGVPG